MAKKKSKSKKVILTPQQEAFLSCYTDPKSPTFSNAYQSALEAGYSKEYAESLTSKSLKWLSENVGDLNRLQKAEKVLDDILDLPHVVQAMGPFGPLFEKGKDKKPIMTVSTAILKVKNDSAKFVAERLNKQKYSTRSEVTAKGGRDLIPSSVEDLDNDTLENILKGRSESRVS